MECPSCGQENPAGSRFCNGCGQPLEPAAPRPEVPAVLAQRDARAYTPRHLADKILRSRSAVEGERKQVTVLFADVKGSTELAEATDPEEWHAILERFFEILADGVHRFEGTINQFTGDGIMALFGAPIAHENHAHRACYAAIHLRDQLRGYGDELRVSKGISQMKSCVAGALGVVLVRNRRTEERHDAVAGVLVDRALEAVHTLGKHLEEPIQDRMPRLEIDLLGKGHRALHVGEEHSDLLALALQRGL